MLNRIEDYTEMTPEIRKACFEELALRKYITAKVVYSGGYDEGSVNEIEVIAEDGSCIQLESDEDFLWNYLASAVYAEYGGFGDIPDTSGTVRFTTETGKIRLNGVRTITEDFDEEIE